MGSYGGGESLTSSGWWAPIPLSFDALRHLPSIPIVRFSLWNYIRNEELPSIRDAITTFRPQGFNPLNWLLPFTKLARIIDGTQLFTFDGRHITLPGSCEYVLAQDVVNGNFSVVAKIDDGKLKSIGLVDKNGDSVEVSADGPVIVNEKPSELPVHQGELHAWRGYYSVFLISRYGVRVHCIADLSVCHIAVNGYYHNRLRGLLGNANSEPYDDTQLPNGKISEKIAEFGDAYKLQQSCPALSVPEQHQHDKDDAASEECRKAFDWNSSLRGCYIFIDPQPYREACAHVVAKASNKQEAACNIAFGYASYCRSENIPISVPDTCQKCQVADATGKKVDHVIGDLYTVTAPQKSADVVLIVDTAIGKPLNELVQSTITELRKELKSRDITDARISVLGYNKGEKYLSHFTSKGQLNVESFKLPELKQSEVLLKNKIIKTGCEQLDNILEKADKLNTQLEDDLGLNSDGLAFREALLYPYRSSASKVILAIRSDSLTHSLNPVRSKLVIHSLVYSFLITYNSFFSSNYWVRKFPMAWLAVVELPFI